MTSITRRSAAAAIALAVGLGAFLPAAPASAAEPERKSVTLSVGTTLIGYLPIFLADKLGLWKDEGLDVKVQNFQAGGSKALQALIGGSTDAVGGWYDHTIQMQAQGKSIVAIALLNDEPGAVLAVKPELKGKVKSGADLKGLRIGVTALGSSGDFLVKYFATKGGLGVREVQTVAIGSGAQAVAAMEQGAVDGTLNFDPAITLMEKKGVAVPAIDMRTEAGARAALGGTPPAAVIYARKDFLDANPETARRLARGAAKALEWMHAHTPAQIAEALPPEYWLGDRDVFEAVVAKSMGMFPKDGRFEPERLQAALDVLKAFDPKVQAASIDIPKTYSNEYLK